MLALTAVLSGCSSASVEELLSPPRLDGEQTEIYDALRTATNSDIILKYPRSGQYRSAFVVTDLDTEPTDEAIVFYEIPNVSDGSSLRMNFLDKQDGRWVSVYDFAASGSEVESVRFEDLGGGSLSIIVNYLVGNSSDRYTSIMTYKDGEPEELANIRNIYMDIFDADGNGTNDLFTITNDRTAGSSVAGLYHINEEDILERLIRIRLNSGYAGIKDVICGNCDEKGCRSIFIDYAFSDGSFGTDAIIYTGGFYYLSPALGSMNIYRCSNSFTPYVPCCDIDGDGVIEIPVSVPFANYAGSPDAEQVNTTVWYTLELSGTYKKEKYRSFIGTKNDYILFFPEKWGSLIAADVSISDSTVRFFGYDESAKLPGEPLLALFGAAEGNTGKYETENFISLGTSPSSGYSYYAQRLSDTYSPGEDELRELFRLQ